MQTRRQTILRAKLLPMRYLREHRQIFLHKHQSDRLSYVRRRQSSPRPKHTMMKTKITEAYALGGNVYEFDGEDERYESINYQVAVRTIDGRCLVHSTFYVPGDFKDEFRIRHVAYGAEAAAKRFAARVQAAGFIDEVFWHELPKEPSLEERWAEQGKIEMMERANMI